MPACLEVNCKHIIVWCIAWSDRIRGQASPGWFVASCKQVQQARSDRRPALARPLGFRPFFETAWPSPRHTPPPAHLNLSASSSAHMRHIQLARASRTVLEAQRPACYRLRQHLRPPLVLTSFEPSSPCPSLPHNLISPCLYTTTPASRPRHPSTLSRVRATGHRPRAPLYHVRAMAASASIAALFETRCTKYACKRSPRRRRMDVFA